ncbi:MAG TPA: anthranilate phosphoribosyltransferase [Gemmatimonadales bacterium]|nr:anthranilate phosphoribosyltransferase [Gemmatimonadales bacterium]
MANSSAQTVLAYTLRRLSEGASLSAAEAAEAFGVVMRGDATPVQIAALLMGLRAKGESAEEIAGAARALRDAMVPLAVDSADSLVDTCGTGGGAIGTLNVSTAAAFVVAGAGVPVAKHGNRSYTSRSGSADVLEALGVNITLSPERAGAVLREAGIVFLFAPSYHPAMRHAAPARKELGVPTIMNLLGPLANPAGVRRQVIGVADRGRAPLVAEALRRLGAVHALVVHAAVGMDEISPSGPTFIWEVRDDRVGEWTLDPAALGLASDDLQDLAGGEPADNAARIESLLVGGNAEAGSAARAAVLLNAAAALYVAGRRLTFEEAVRCAEATVREGRAAAVLERLRAASAR